MEMHSRGQSSEEIQGWHGSAFPQVSSTSESKVIAPARLDQKGENHKAAISVAIWAKEWKEVSTTAEGHMSGMAVVWVESVTKGEKRFLFTRGSCLPKEK